VPEGSHRDAVLFGAIPGVKAASTDRLDGRHRDSWKDEGEALKET
jgi:hypothetical protein